MRLRGFVVLLVWLKFDLVECANGFGRVVVQKHVCGADGLVRGCCSSSSTQSACLGQTCRHKCWWFGRTHSQLEQVPYAQLKTHSDVPGFDSRVAVRASKHIHTYGKAIASSPSNSYWLAGLAWLGLRVVDCIRGFVVVVECWVFAT